MRTKYLLDQHKRCECLLEMIAKCNQRIASYKVSIDFYKSDKFSNHMVDWYYKRWSITLDVKARLASAYSDTLTAIVRPTVNKILND